jgi:hypothetical protein
MPHIFRRSRNDSQKLTFIMSSIAVSLMLFAYQNCGKINSSGGTPDGSVEQKPAVASLDDVTNLTLLGSKDDGMGMYAYDVNVDTGEVVRTLNEVPADDPANTPAHLCLTDAQKTELKNLLNSSNVCFYQFQRNSQMVCTQQYIYPYAVVKEINLGYTGGCSDYHEICKDNRDAFVNEIKAILATIDQSSCPQ